MQNWQLHRAPRPLYQTVERIHHVKTPQEWTDLDDAIQAHYVAYGPDGTRVEIVESLVRQVEAFVRRVIPTAELEIYGSYNNGFFTNDSDIDLCFRFAGNPKRPELLSEGVILKRIAELMEAQGHTARTIIDTKVPIVKSNILHPFRVDLDIAYYNETGTANSGLLRAYHEWDERMGPLFIWAKKWAKRADIGSGANGSLSSFILSVMLIHFLQQRNVLPYLQDDFRRGGEERMVDLGSGPRDVYFHEGGPPHGWVRRNDESVGRLWAGFLEYYSEFDFNTQVVSIRRWATPYDPRYIMYIEDPFSQRLNMTASTRWTMFEHIQRTIRHSRKMTMIPTIRRNLLNQRWAPRALFISRYYDSLLHVCKYDPAPDVSHCRMCNQAGHYMDQCPLQAVQLEMERRAAVDAFLGYNPPQPWSYPGGCVHQDRCRYREPTALRKQLQADLEEKRRIQKAAVSYALRQAFKPLSKRRRTESTS